MDFSPFGRSSSFGEASSSKFGENFDDADPPGGANKTLECDELIGFFDAIEQGRLRTTEDVASDAEAGGEGNAEGNAAEVDDGNVESLKGEGERNKLPKKGRRRRVWRAVWPIKGKRLGGENATDTSPTKGRTKDKSFASENNASVRGKDEGSTHKARSQYRKADLYKTSVHGLLAERYAELAFKAAGRVLESPRGVLPVRTPKTPRGSSASATPSRVHTGLQSKQVRAMQRSLPTNDEMSPDALFSSSSDNSTESEGGLRHTLADDADNYVEISSVCSGGLAPPNSLASNSSSDSDSGSRKSKAAEKIGLTNGLRRGLRRLGGGMSSIVDGKRAEKTALSHSHQQGSWKQRWREGSSLVAESDKILPNNRQPLLVNACWGGTLLFVNSVCDRVAVSTPQLLRISERDTHPAPQSPRQSSPDQVWPPELPPVPLALM